MNEKFEAAARGPSFFHASRNSRDQVRNSTRYPLAAIRAGYSVLIFMNGKLHCDIKLNSAVLTLYIYRAYKFTYVKTVNKYIYLFTIKFSSTYLS